MAVNLSRSAKVYFSTEDGSVPGNMDGTNTFQIQVLDGFSFTQSVETTTIELSEAGVAPIRGNRSFNTQLNAAEWSFNAYIRPYREDGLNTPADDFIAAPEFPLWAALIGDNLNLFTAAMPAVANTSDSNKNQMLVFNLFFVVDNSVYKLENSAVNTAEISFDLTGIAQIAWSGFANRLVDMTATGGLRAKLDTITFPITPEADTFIVNKLSTVILEAGIGGSGKTYTVPITGGTFTYSNNIEFVIPESLGVVNNSIGYFTGSRSISGNLTAYLKTGANESAELLDDMLLQSHSTTEPKFACTIQIGGGSNTTKVELEMQAIFLQIPNVEVQDVVSVSMDFTAQGYSGSDYDASATNDLTVRYYHA